MEITTRHYILLLLLMLFATAGPQAAVKSGDTGLTPLQQDFLAAEKALGKDPLKYNTLKTRLEHSDYPLLPYLELQELLSRLTQLKSDEVERFLNRYADTHLSHRLRGKWLSHLAKKRRWWTYRAFSKPSGNTKRQCTHLWALHNTGHQEEALSGASRIWLSGSSLPKACDPLLEALQQSELFNPELVWKRIDLAMAKNNSRLARYLGRFLPKKQKVWLDQWLQLHRKPEQVARLSTRHDGHPYKQQMIHHGMKRLARKDLDAALKSWQKISSQAGLNEDTGYKIERYLGFRMASKNHQDVLSWMERVSPREGDLKYAERRLRMALSLQQWEHFLSWLDSTPETLRKQENWRYWRAYALAETDQWDKAYLLFRELAAERSYHGFLAADRLRLDYHLEHTPLELDSSRLDRVSKHPGLLRARELLALDRLPDARREWRYVTRGMDQGELQAAAKLAQSWSWHDRAIFTLARTGYWDDLELRFPLEHHARITGNAEKQQLDEAWVFAVIRQESAFSRDAISPAGAMGLMQLMPKTAKSVAKRLRHPKPRKRDLLNPKTNIKLGTGYLRQVMNQLGEHQVLATAAYNAGPHRVKSWLPEKPVDAEIWIETIPFTETRRYTQRVLAYSVIYEQRLGGEPARMSNKLRPVLPKQRLAPASIAKAEGTLSAGSSSL
ncbi:MAG: transglycosylase SLT domain-containing protein [Sedimenticola sp.]